MNHIKPKILIISRNKFIAYRLYINLIAFDAEINLVKSISQINKNIFLDDYDLAIINIAKVEDIRSLKLIDIKNSKTKFLFINNLKLLKEHNYKNFLNSDFSDTDILLKTGNLLQGSF